MKSSTTQMFSIVIPVYNEELTIEEVLKKVSEQCLSLVWVFEIIIVDDYSTDNTTKIIKQFIQDNPAFIVKSVFHPKNKGKGAALRTGFSHAEGDIIIIQDADLEYDPKDYKALCSPILENQADVVYGSRFIGDKPHRVLYFWHLVANKTLTLLCNILTNINLTDMETCYKAFKSKLLKDIILNENRFGFEPEFTIKVSRIPNIRIYEVGISYYGRTYAQGKKITIQDGMWAFYCILKYGIFYRK